MLYYFEVCFNPGQSETLFCMQHTEPTCVSAYQLQCYDAFSMAVPAVDTQGGSTDDCTTSTVHSSWFLGTIVAVVCVVNWFLFAVVLWYVTGRGGMSAGASSSADGVVKNPVSSA